MRFFRRNVFMILLSLCFFSFGLISMYKEDKNINILALIIMILFYTSFYFIDKKKEKEEIKINKLGILISSDKYNFLKNCLSQDEEEKLLGEVNNDKLSFEKFEELVLQKNENHNNNDKILITWDMIENWKLVEGTGRNSNRRINIRIKVKGINEYLEVKSPYINKNIFKAIPEKRIKSQLDKLEWIINK